MTRVWTVNGVKVDIDRITPDTPATRAHARGRIERALKRGAVGGSWLDGRCECRWSTDSTYRRPKAPSG